MSEEQKCRFHGLSRESICNWCGEIICIQCIEAANHKKYCPRCYKKLSKDSVARSLEKRWGEKPGEKVINIDTELSEDEIKQRRKMIEVKEKAKKILGEH